MNADTTVHLAHVQAFFFFIKKNSKITSMCLSNFKGPIVSYFSAAESCEQRPFFLVTQLSSKILVTFMIVKSPKLNPVNRPKREHRRERIPKE